MRLVLLFLAECSSTSGEEGWFMISIDGTYGPMRRLAKACRP